MPIHHQQSYPQFVWITRLIPPAIFPKTSKPLEGKEPKAENAIMPKKGSGETRVTQNQQTLNISREEIMQRIQTQVLGIIGARFGLAAATEIKSSGLLDDMIRQAKEHPETQQYSNGEPLLTTVAISRMKSHVLHLLMQNETVREIIEKHEIDEVKRAAELILDADHNQQSGDMEDQDEEYEDEDDDDSIEISEMEAEWFDTADPRETE
jgi:phosphopantothenoylcysteine synthetase/decarboxylase